MIDAAHRYENELAAAADRASGSGRALGGWAHDHAGLGVEAAAAEAE